MSEDFRPRKNDHLVEPIFEALADPVAEDAPLEAPASRSIYWWLIPGLLVPTALYFWLS